MSTHFWQVEQVVQTDDLGSYYLRRVLGVDAVNRILSTFLSQGCLYTINKGTYRKEFHPAL